MVDDPPAEAFEPQPDDGHGEGRLRRRFRIALTLTVVTAIVVLAAIEGSGYLIRTKPAEPAAPTPEPVIPRLAVVDAAGALSTMDERGGSVVGYPVPGIRFQFPAWSPDGSRVAAIGGGPTNTGVYVFAIPRPVADGPGASAAASAAAPAAPVVIYESADRPPFYLFWSPDGSQITFLTTEPDGIALRIAPAEGTTAASLVRAGAPMYWDFVEPGRLLVHSGLSGPEGFLDEVGADGVPIEPDQAPFAGGGTPGVFRAPGVSRDGRYRAYVAAGEGAIGEVVREGRDGAATNRIRVFGPGAVSFSPVGDELAFVALDQVSNQALPLPVGPLRVMDVGSVEPRTLVTGSVVGFMWSPDGRQIAALLLDQPDDNVTEAAVGRIVAARATAAGLSLRLVFVDVATGSIRSERVVRVSDTFLNQVLPFFDQYALSHRFWSPDGAAVVLPIVGEGDVVQLLAIPADGSAAHTVATAEMGFWSP